MTFTIIIPVYNVAEYMSTTLDSIVAQTYNDWECICVDDGSTDSSGGMCDEYALRDKRVRVIHQANIGVSTARNRGIEIAKGDWLLFLDADDILSPYALQELKSVIESFPNVSLVKFDYIPFEHSLIFQDAKSDVNHSNVKKVDVSKVVEFDDFFCYMWRWCYRKTMLGNHRFNPNYHGMEDRVFIAKCILELVDNYIYLPMQLYGYRQRAESVSHVRIKPIRAAKGELLYRIEMMKLVDACGRTISMPGFARTRVMAGYYLHDALMAFVGRPSSEKEVLWGLWYAAVGYLKDRKDITFCQKLVFCICGTFKIRLVAWFLGYVLPRLLDGGNPVRALFKIFKRLNVIA